MGKPNPSAGKPKAAVARHKNKGKGFAPGEPRNKFNKSLPPGKLQWRKKKPQDEARKQKLKEREELRTRKIAEAKAEKERVQLEKQERIKTYKKKRLERTKAISKKTQRGQPLMKDRMQLLLKQIQEMKRSG